MEKQGFFFFFFLQSWCAPTIFAYPIRHDGVTSLEPHYGELTTYLFFLESFPSDLFVVSFGNLFSDLFSTTGERNTATSWNIDFVDCCLRFALLRRIFLSDRI